MASKLQIEKLCSRSVSKSGVIQMMTAWMMIKMCIWMTFPGFKIQWTRQEHRHNT